MEPAQPLYYGAYTLARAKQQDTAEANFEFLESRGLAEMLPAEMKQTALKVLLPLRHVAWGGNMNNAYMCAYGYGTAFTQPCIYHAMDHLGIAQYLTRVGLLLGDVADLDQAKDAWMNDSAWQGLRRYVEDSFVVKDPVELFVAQNVALDGLLYPLAYETIVDDVFSSEGGTALALLTQFMTEWLDQIAHDKDHISHQAWATFYNYAAACNFHTWIPNDDELDWLSQKYPNSFDKYYRPRLEHWREEAKKGNRFYNKTLPMLCQTCQIPMIFTEPGDPTQICYRESDYQGSKFHFCSDGCKEIFDHEPEKYAQAWLPVHQIYQGHCFEPGVDPTAEGFDPLSAVLDHYHLAQGRDNLDFEGSKDQKNFDEWRGMATRNA